MNDDAHFLMSLNDTLTCGLGACVLLFIVFVILVTIEEPSAGQGQQQKSAADAAVAAIGDERARASAPLTVRIRGQCSFVKNIRFDSDEAQTPVVYIDRRESPKAAKVAELAEEYGVALASEAKAVVEEEVARLDEQLRLARASEAKVVMEAELADRHKKALVEAVRTEAVKVVEDYKQRRSAHQKDVQKTLQTNVHKLSRQYRKDMREANRRSLVAPGLLRKYRMDLFKAMKVATEVEEFEFFEEYSASASEEKVVEFTEEYREALKETVQTEEEKVAKLTNKYGEYLNKIVQAEDEKVKEYREALKETVQAEEEKVAELTNRGRKDLHELVNAKRMVQFIKDFMIYLATEVWHETEAKMDKLTEEYRKAPASEAKEVEHAGEDKAAPTSKATVAELTEKHRKALASKAKVAELAGEEICVAFLRHPRPSPGARIDIRSKTVPESGIVLTATWGGRNLTGDQGIEWSSYLHENRLGKNDYVLATVQADDEYEPVRWVR